MSSENDFDYEELIKELEIVIVKLIRVFPLFSIPAMVLGRKWTTEIPTAAVSEDGYLLINPEFWQQLDSASKLLTIAHEFLHAILKHPQRYRELDDANAVIFNYAADLHCNNWGRAIAEKAGGQGFSIWPHLVTFKKLEEWADIKNINLPENVRAMSAEELYELLKEILKEQSNKNGNSRNSGSVWNNSNCSGSGSGNNNGNNNNESNNNGSVGGNGSEEQEGNQGNNRNGTGNNENNKNKHDGSGVGENGGKKQGDDQHSGNGRNSIDPRDVLGDLPGAEKANDLKPKNGKDMNGKEVKKPSDDFQKDPQKAWNKVARDVYGAAATYKNAGISGSFDELIDEIIAQYTKGVINWRKEIINIVSATLKKSQRTWKRPSRRFEDRKIMHKGRKKLPQPDLIVFIDVSGSVDEEEIQEGLNEILGFMAAVGGKVTIVQWDTEIVSVDEYRARKKLVFQRMSAGGTTFINSLEDLKNNYPDVYRSLKNSIVLLVSDFYWADDYEDAKKAVLELIRKTQKLIAFDTESKTVATDRKALELIH